MPKRIENLRESIVTSARAALLAEGYDALAIRSVAADCGIAVGTVYNYFPSKDMLAAAVMLDDWLQTLERMRRSCRRAACLSEAMDALYAGVTAFRGRYGGVWAGYTFSEKARSEYGERHKLLVRQLADCLNPLLERLAAADAGDTAVFLAENLLICADGSEMSYGSFLRIAEKLLSSSH